jgi:HEAT repeat protein
MDNLATRGPVNVGDALAALALVRALLKTLQAKRVIGTSDVNSIVADALGQIGPLSSTDAGREARRLIQKVQSTFKSAVNDSTAYRRNN